jgi:hypothetical protein
LILGIALGCLVAGVLIAVAVLRSTPPAFGDAVASTNILTSGTCSQSDVVAAASTVPIIDPARAASHVTLLPGEPAVVAKVNSDSISAVELEMGVSFTVAAHQKALQQANNGPSGTLSPSERAELTKPVHQIRHELFDRLIAQRLLLQEGQRLNLGPSDVAARAYAQQQAQLMRSLRPTDPGFSTIQAYLCVNQLTPDTFGSDPRVIQGYRDQLTIGAAEQKATATLSPDQQRDPAARQAAIDAHTQQLRQNANVQLFITV